MNDCETKELTQEEYTVLEKLLYKFYGISEGVIYNGDMTIKMQDGKVVYGTKLDKKKAYRKP